MAKSVDVEDVCKEIGKFIGYLDEDMILRLQTAIRRIPEKEDETANWILIGNPSYSPFDGSEPYKYICPNCQSVEYSKTKYCPDCGKKMKLWKG